ncbi:serine O-acetyltransferase EpsC [Treponema saccharophilum]|uniref:serine O-acetyltransferase EpsC n=1 Tax=Treponema saccharophilum TaxID=165 RepID=UPI0038631067
MSIDETIDRILVSYEETGDINKNGNRAFPNKENVVEVLHDLQSLIFPGFKKAEDIDADNLRYITGQKVNRIITMLTKEIQKALVYECASCDDRGAPEKSHCYALSEKTAVALIEAVPELRREIHLDALAAFAGDPAAKSNEEVIVSYPGLEAIVTYRIAHFLFVNGVPVIPRIMTEYSHSRTGIDIHPGAEIGESFFIDHGTGVVIGETTVIGKNVKIYQGVTLGALSVKKSLQDKKRHPTIEDNVTIYANATILGGQTVIGAGSTIGGNTWVMRSVAPNTMVTQ